MKKGFTLVELAIVLVIVGLLVGGVLAGQELIKQAKINKTISELQNIERAWVTFYTKYNGYPGDLKNPTRFFPVCNASKAGGPANIVGNGNGLLWNGEPYCAWPQLVISGLYMPVALKKDEIDIGNPSDDINFSAGDGSADAWWLGVKRVNQNIADADTFGMTGGVIKKNALLVQNVDTGGAFTEEEMYSVDRKIDNGKPNTGLLYTTGDAEYDLSISGKVLILIYNLQ